MKGLSALLLARPDTCRCAAIGLYPDEGRGLFSAGDVRFGSKADISECSADVCFTPRKRTSEPDLCLPVKKLSSFNLGRLL
jgi:hypothetical protein